jgi:acetaldehyde dehydrogenase (acetylating)
MKIIVLLAIMFVVYDTYCQPLVKVEVSSDTIATGELVEVTYTIENGEGKFNMPDLTGLPVVSGPNSSSSFMYQNGMMSSFQSYSFSLLPREVGMLLIPATTYVSKTENLTIQPVTIIVGAGSSKPSTVKVVPETSSSKSTREKRKF